MSKSEGDTYLDHNVKLKKPAIFYRYFILFMILITMMVVFSVRCTINVAIIAMVGKPVENNGTINATIKDSKKHFDWDQNDQGIVLGAYYYTYATVQIFAGLLTDKFNVVHLMAGSQVVAIICTMLTPLAANISMSYLVVIRMILGLVHGITFPSVYNLIENWFPPAETGLAQGLMAGGCDFGTALISLFTAWISQQNFLGGWPAAFYLIGIVNLIFTITWIITVTRNPFENKFVSDYEKRYLSQVLIKKQVKKRQRSTPWIKLLTSIPLWSVILTKGLIGLAYSVINSKIPVYLDSVLGYKLENNGLINSFFYLAVGTSQLVCGPVSKYIITKGWLSVMITRKLFESIALAGIIASLISICYLKNTELIVFCLVLSMFFYGFNLGGDVPIVPEMAPGLVGTAFGFSNVLACAAGFIAPALIGAILGDDAGSRSKWILSFQIVAGLQLVALILFNLFATTEPQPWGKVEEDDEESSPTDQPPPLKLVETIST